MRFCVCQSKIPCKITAFYTIFIKEKHKIVVQ